MICVGLINCGDVQYKMLLAGYVEMVSSQRGHFLLKGEVFTSLKDHKMKFKLSVYNVSKCRK